MFGFTNEIFQSWSSANPNLGNSFFKKTRKMSLIVIAPTSLLITLKRGMELVKS
ncbi:hypothetical protein RV00_GL000196 [Enterococcus devriesei]|uniref:Uncharacterized protein n=1 Tax=Enterococcus devriesei TaxID=319970 RepID=A0A1L8SYT7_9ENTE|nr:hypothetical protein RV00_GL000196 [Enterococcus devriesei]